MAEILIYARGDQERLADLRRAVDVAERKYDAAKAEAEQNAGAPRRAGDDEASAVTTAKEELAAARAACTAAIDEAADRAEVWELDTIGHEEFRQLLKDHPPRTVTKTDDEGKEREETHPDDLIPGDVNTETYPKALLLFVDPEDDEIRTIIKPEFDTQAALRKRVKRLSAGQFDTLWLTAHQMNGGLLADPKASRYYDGTPRSDET